MEERIYNTLILGQLPNAPKLTELSLVLQAQWKDLAKTFGGLLDSTVNEWRKSKN